MFTNWPIFVAPLLAVAAAMVCDLRNREIPDGISLALLAWAAAAAVFGFHGVWWASLLTGAVLGFVLSAPLFYLGGLGGGDVKLLTALGAAIGPGWLLLVVFWMGLAGGLLALIAAIRSKPDFAYGPAIAAGVLMTAIYPDLLSHVLS